MCNMIDKELRFKRLAELRGNRIIKDLRLLSNLSNKSNYSYSADEVKAIFNAIDDELKNTKQCFKKDTRRKISL
ncbi:hypothetical protein IJI89_00165 [Candidatus Saccharibacteria bacterium]|nr:hypothetical protein [Candidatus Saccharibacteria bacterium]